MHGNQTVDWSRIDSERVSGWSRFRNGKKKTADSRYRQKTIAAYSNMHLHNNTIIGAHFNRTIFRIYWVHLVLFLHAIFFCCLLLLLLQTMYRTKRQLEPTEPHQQR